MVSVAQGRASARLRKKGCKPGWEVLHMQKSTENQTSEGVTLFLDLFLGVSERTTLQRLASLLLVQRR